jgi:putative restriction endonuclease
MALQDITRSTVLEAIAEFNDIGRDAFLSKYGFGPARSYFLEHDGQLFDSKAIIGAAHQYVPGGDGPLRPSEFSGGEATVATHLRRLGFAVQSPDASAEMGDDTRFWWVNHKQTFTQEVGGNYIWSPRARADGGRNEFYENMRRVRPGEIVFSFANALIQAVGVCVAPAFLAPKPDDFGIAGEAWDDEGWRVPVEFKRLSKPIRPKDHMDVLAPLLPDKYSPIRPSGDGNQGAYLAAVPSAMADALIALIGDEWSELGVSVVTASDDADAAIEETDRAIEEGIRNRTDLSETEKLSLVRARRGQGIYRKNLEQFETRCRVTGVSDLKHLRASHIKPWRASTNFEKLDGNNGLLLSPHVDHLFDQGYISFTDTGALLISQALEAGTLEHWAIAEDVNVGPFRPEQLPYLAFHRDSVFIG